MLENNIYTIPWENGISEVDVFGAGNANIKFIENNIDVMIKPGADGIVIEGSQADKAYELLTGLIKHIKSGHAPGVNAAEYFYGVMQQGGDIGEDYVDTVCNTFRGRPIRCKTYGQKHYIDSMRESEITFCIGPAGTGKTYLAMAMAVNSLKNGDVNRIVLVRPAVEAGERLGFLPGDLKEKVDPYLRPLYDALYDLIGSDACERYLSRGTIEIAPLAYMRGRTLDDSFVVLDEAQNTTPEQMKMFLTRLGFASKAVITGDVTQIDLPFKSGSALREIKNILYGVNGIAFAELTNADVVRNPIVQRIINAYEKFEARQSEQQE